MHYIEMPWIRWVSLHGAVQSETRNFSLARKLHAPVHQSTLKLGSVEAFFNCRRHSPGNSFSHAGVLHQLQREHGTLMLTSAEEVLSSFSAKRDRLPVSLHDCYGGQMWDATLYLADLPITAAVVMSRRYQAR